MLFGDKSLHRKEGVILKKSFWLSAVLLLVFALAAGCSSKDEEKNTDKKDSGKEDTKSALLDFYMTIPNTINQHDADLNTYELAEDRSTLPKDAKQKASDSAKASAEAVKKIEIPDDLKEYKADFEEALKSFSDSYEQKADELAKSAEPNLDAANETFTKGEETLGKVFKDADLTPPTPSAEVNG